MRFTVLFSVLAALFYGVALVAFRLVPINDALVFAALLWGVAALLEKADDHRRCMGLHAVTLIITIGWVFSLWTVGYEGRSAVFGGILPWSDSFDYLSDALRLTHGHLLEFGAKRPLYPVSLAGLMSLTGNQLRLVLLIYAAFGAFAVALAVNAVWDSHGRKAALIVWVLLLFSLRHWAGYVQTEAIGLPLGLIGFTLIWQSRADKRVVAAGLLAITMALMARAGAFFVLPAVALWAMMEAPRDKRLGTLLWCAGAIAGGMAVHEAALKLTAHGLSFGDYPAIVFGLIHHKDYTYLSELHPALNTFTDGEKTVQAWHLVFAEIASRPLALLLGMLRSFAELFYTPNGLFGFVWRNPDDVIFENGPAVRAALHQYGLIGPVVYWVQSKGPYSFANGVAMGALGLGFVISTIAGLAALYRRAEGHHARLLRFAVAGVLISAPFTPPWITGAHQVEVATLAFMAMVPALWWSTARGQPGRAAPLGLTASPLAIAALLMACALLLKPGRSAVAGEPVMEMIPGTTVRILARPVLGQAVAAADMAVALQFLKKHNSELTASLAPYLKPGTVYRLAYDRQAATAKILIDTDGWIGPQPRYRVDAMALHTPAVEWVRRAAIAP